MAFRSLSLFGLILRLTTHSVDQFIGDEFISLGRPLVILTLILISDWLYVLFHLVRDYLLRDFSLNPVKTFINEFLLAVELL